MVKLKNEMETCCLCRSKTKYIRHTQFAGSHPFCKEHGESEKGFMNNDSYQYWEVK